MTTIGLLTGGGFVATAAVLNELGFNGYLVLENDYSDDAIRRMAGI